MFRLTRPFRDPEETPEISRTQQIHRASISLRRASCALPPQRYIHMIHFKRPRQMSRVQRRLLWRLNIQNFPANLTKEMPMLPHIRAKPHRRPIQNHLPHQPALHQHTQTIIDRRKRNLRIRPLRPLKNLLRRRMIMALCQHIKHLLPLPRHPQPARRQPAGQTFMFMRRHSS